MNNLVGGTDERRYDSIKGKTYFIQNVVIIRIVIFIYYYIFVKFTILFGKKKSYFTTIFKGTNPMK